MKCLKCRKKIRWYQKKWYWSRGNYTHVKCLADNYNNQKFKVKTDGNNKDSLLVRS